MPQTINLGSLQLKFLQTKDGTDGSLDMFEMTLQPNARMPIPHYHDRWDETIYGLTGTSTWRIDGKDIDLAPGETVFIKRGVVHGFTNRSTAPASCLCTLSPGVLGPQYFKDMASLLSAGAPDPARMKETMLRYGLIPRRRPEVVGPMVANLSSARGKLEVSQDRGHQDKALITVPTSSLTKISCPSS
jgi:quercetin dioxygenase-like cupin family protein